MKIIKIHSHRSSHDVKIASDGSKIKCQFVVTKDGNLKLVLRPGQTCTKSQNAMDDRICDYVLGGHGKVVSTENRVKSNDLYPMPHAEKESPLVPITEHPGFY